VDSHRWDEIQSTFDTLVELDDVERGSRLTALRNSDPELRAAVELLLAADSEVDARLAALDDVFFPQSLPSSDPLGLAGQTVSHFEIGESIGAGGMGVVYRARDIRLGREVALKFLLPSFGLAAGAEARFLREARLVATLDHRNLCAVHEVGMSDDGRPFLAMTLYPGETLKARMTRDGPMPVSDVLAIARQVSDGLDCAHRAGIVHRDLKPGNIMLLPDGTAKILDFGLAKAKDQSLTESGARFGTVSYMAPEQIRGETADARADLWALGVVLYEMLTARKPFGGEQDIAIAHAILHEAPVPLIVHRRDLSAAVEDLVLRLLQKNPAKRYATASELLSEIARVDKADERNIESLGTRWRRARRTLDYRLGASRFVGRTRFVASVIALTLIAGSAFMIASMPGSSSGIFRQQAALDPRRVAVLYFEDITPDQSLGYLASGLTESLIQELSVAPTIRVVARNGVRPFRDNPVSPDSIARRLSTGTIVEGTIQRSGDSLRVTAHIVDGSTNTRVESTRIERRMGELFLLEDELAQQVAGLLRRRIGLEIRLRETAAETKSVRARDLVFRANEARDEAEALTSSGGVESARGLSLLRQADSLFEEAEEADRNWPGPVIGRGWVAYESGLRQGGERSKEAFEGAIGHADRVLLRDSVNAPALELRGTARYSKMLRFPGNDSDFRLMLAGAEADLKRAVAIEPALASAWGTLSRVHVARGDLATAERDARKALSMDAYLRDAPRILWGIYRASLMADSMANAWRWCQRGGREFPRNPQFIDCRVTLMAEDRRTTPDPKLAWNLVAEGERIEPQDRATASGRTYLPTFRRMMAAVVSARAGQKDSARAVAARARAFVGNDRVLSTDLKYDDAFLQVALGDEPAALRLLSEYLTERPSLANLVSKHHRWSPLQDNGDFHELIRRSTDGR
jgi:serine/threonine-protein kinase